MRSNLKWVLILLGISLAAQGLTTVLPPYIAQLFILAAINAVLAVSLNLVNGLSGQFSLGQAGFMAVGAYTAASVNVFLLSSLRGTPAGDQAALVISLIVAALASGFVGYLVGLPTLRLRGDYLAIVTLGFGEIIRVVILNIQAVGGARGFTNIPNSTSAFLVVFILALCVLLTHRFVMASQGRALLAIRENEIAAEAMGVNTTSYKVVAFVVSSAVAGVAGGLFAHYLSYINPSSFDFMKSVEIVIMVVLGGMGSVSGAILAAFILTFLPEALRPLQDLTHVDLRMVIYSLLLILMMLMRPQGIFGRRELWQIFPVSKTAKSIK
ncbi:MAG TPA: branched-chain amino acid ABC transporter permease [bacterium]|jgi:branched-chain amino acid transport system permease protein|nr:branched-chain amino acid ABC transporter permease [bacterium]